MPSYRNCVITRVERVENRVLHENYTVQRRRSVETITKTLDTVSPSHQTRCCMGCCIMMTLTKLPMLAGTQVGVIWGIGTYCARDAKYRHAYTESKNDVLTEQSQRKMLLNGVIVGQWVKGEEEMKLYPNVKGEKYQYNSMVNDVDNPSIFVIQHSNQTYPAYVITYTSA